jgi:hypothetical protein
MNACFQRHPALRLTSIEDEGIALQLDTRCYFSVNQTGLFVLEALHRPLSADQLADALLEQYDVTADHARASVLRFLASCQGSELVVRVEATARAIA